MRWLNASRVALRAVRRYNPSPPSAATVSWLSTKSCWLGDQNIVLMGPPGAGKTSVGRIVQRLGLLLMKVNRIVGQEAGMSMRDILGYRKQFYERWLNIRVLCGVGDTVEQVAEKVMHAVERYHHPDTETYVSTRGG